MTAKLVRYFQSESYTVSFHKIKMDDLVMLGAPNVSSEQNSKYFLTKQEFSIPGVGAHAMTIYRKNSRQ
jgi:hypothetical protein